MQLFTYAPTRPFKRGPLGESYIPLTLLPVNEVIGVGTMIHRQLNVFSLPQVQVQAVPNAWNGMISGTFVLQPLVDQNGQAASTYSDDTNGL